MNKIISMSLFGDADMYFKSFPGTLLSYKNIFPDWEILIFTGQEIERHPTYELFKRLEDMNWFDQYRMPRLMNVNAKCLQMLWRLRPCFFDCDFLMCRDIDSLALARDRKRIEVFIQSGMAAHAGADEAQHLGCNFLGGITGFNRKLFFERIGINTFEELWSEAHKYASLEEWQRHGTDQNFLNQYIWPRMLGSICEHRFRNFRMDTSSPSFPIEEAEKVELTDVKEEVQIGSDAIGQYIGRAGFSGQDYKDWVALDGFMQLPEAMEGCGEKCKEFYRSWDML